jgi:poly-gamma-glutamate synthesis protein (capsule biosynthesis protein)
VASLLIIMKEHARLIVLGAIFVVCAAYVAVHVYGVLLGSTIDRFSRTEPSTILFTGDIMLARDVEDRMRAIGEASFFDLVRPLHERAQYVVANFEAAVPDDYVPTPDFTFQFSVDHALLPFLRDAHVTHVSLANNHADDYGIDARRQTVTTLRDAGFVPFGQPRGVASTSVTTLRLDGRQIAIIGLEDVLAPLDQSAVLETIRNTTSSTDVQIVYIHWGNEYELVHSDRQEELATAFIEAGADAVIGHHPHVVQDIALIDGVPVIYSLGNYVFDQYWDDEVQRGLTALLGVSNDTIVIELVPVRIDRARPRVMSEEEKSSFLYELALRSDESVRSMLVRGFVSGRLH